MKTPTFWHEDGLKSRALVAISWLYRLSAWLDRETTTPLRAPLPVIAVGNLTAGGAGKTPTALALGTLLQQMGATPHFITRGYGASAAHTAHRVTPEDTATMVGDEALLLARIAPTWVGVDRLASARAAHAAGASVVVCDDGLQHHRLQKDLALLVIDGAYGLGNGRLIPAGPLRETKASGFARAHAVLVIGEDRQAVTKDCPLPVFHAALAPTCAVEPLRAERWLAFAGLARPEKFFTSLTALGLELAATRPFADHYAYTEADLAQLVQEAAALGAKLITTEKDAVKLPAALAAEVVVLPVALRFEEPDAVRALLSDLHTA